jgi:hypothetical protein
MNARELKKSWSRKYNWLKRHPRQWVRVGAGIALVVGGILGPVVPILGAWMLPFGAVLLVANSPSYWRVRRRYVGWRRGRKLRRLQLTTVPADTTPAQGNKRA